MSWCLRFMLLCSASVLYRRKGDSVAALWVTLGLMVIVFAGALVAMDLFSQDLRRGNVKHVNTEVCGYVDMYTGVLTRTRWPVKGPPP